MKEKSLLFPTISSRKIAEDNARLERFGADPVSGVDRIKNAAALRKSQELWDAAAKLFPAMFTNDKPQ